MTQPMLFNEMADDQKAKDKTKALDNRRKAPEPTAEDIAKRLQVIARGQEEMVLDSLAMLSGSASRIKIIVEMKKRLGADALSGDEALKAIGRLLAAGEMSPSCETLAEDERVYTPREGT